MGSTEQFKSAIVDTLNNILHNAHQNKLSKIVDYDAFVHSLKQTMVKNKIPFYAISKSELHKTTINFELPFAKTCHVRLEQFQDTSDKVAILNINGYDVRKLKLSQYDAKYMTRAAAALVDYFKKYVSLIPNVDEE